LVVSVSVCVLIFFLLTDPATTEIYTLSLHDALPIWSPRMLHRALLGGLPFVLCFVVGIQALSPRGAIVGPPCRSFEFSIKCFPRSEEHTSELQSRENLVCRLLLEKKKRQQT